MKKFSGIYWFLILLATTATGVFDVIVLAGAALYAAIIGVWFAGSGIGAHLSRPKPYVEERPKKKPAPPAPPPLSIDELTQQAQKVYDDECRSIRAMNLDAMEEKVVLDQARQRFMQRLKTILP